MRSWKRSHNIVIVKGKGFYLIDDQGKRYLDGTSSMWCNVWGHTKHEIVEAMLDQTRSLQHSTMFGLANRPSIELADKLLKLTRRMDHVFYSDDGSTAVEVAMKMAVQYWRNKGKPKKSQFISLENAYHGDTIGAMSIGYIPKYFAPYKKLLKKVLKVPQPMLGHLSREPHSTLDGCLEKTEAVLSQHSSRCCALIMESGAQIAGGLTIYPSGYQKRIAQLCRKYDVLLVLDEIATGFGRLGNMIEYVAQQSNPDIVCLGKALTAGYSPLAATLTTDKIFRAFLGKQEMNKALYHGHTFTGHPIGCAAAIANIELYKKSNLIDTIRRSSRYLSQRMNELHYSRIASNLRIKGLLGGTDISYKDRPITTLRNKLTLSHFISAESLKRGVYIRSLGNTVVIIPPLAVDRKGLKLLMDTVRFVLEKIENLV